MFCLFLAANVERKNKIPNKMLLFFEKSIVFCHLYPFGGDFRKRRNVLFHTSKCFLLKAETFFKKPVAFWLLSGDLCGRGWEKAVWRSFWKGADDAAESCGRWSRIVRSLRPDCAVVTTPLSAPCWQRVQTWSGRGVSECFLMLVCRILCGIQPLLQFLCGRCRVRSFRSANEWHRFPVRIPSGRS